MRFLLGLLRAQVGALLGLMLISCASLKADENVVASGTAIPISVDWNTVVGKTTPCSYGINGFTAFDPVNAANPKYQSNLAYLGAGLIRFHSWEMLGDSQVNANGWLDIKNKCWDAAKVQAALAPFKESKAAILINIPGFPSWFKTTDDILDDSEAKNFADFCASLVRIVNVQGKAHVKYWEITNERDDPYWVHAIQNKSTTRVADLAKLFNQCAAAMKAVDPSIKTGAPAASRPDFLPQLREFAKDTLPNLDFFSIHAYASGSKDDSDLTIFEKAKAFGDRVKDVRQMLDEVSPARHIPLHLNEYNISWSWQIQDPRMKNYLGAIFDALALTSMARGGAEATCAWNERDGVYGKMDMDYNLRPSADVFHLLNAHGVGNIVATSVGDSDRIAAFAVQGPQQGDRLLLLINESLSDHQISLNLGVWKGRVEKFTITKDGARDEKVDLSILDGSYTLPGHSLCFLTTTAGGESGSPVSAK